MSLFLRPCRHCEVRVTYRMVENTWRTFITHDDDCPDPDTDLEPAARGVIP